MFTVARPSSGAMVRAVLPFTVAVVAGVALWTAAAIAGGRREPWDSALYWSTSYPAALALAVALGLVFPDRPWRWAVALVCSQILVMAASSPSFDLLPLGMIVLAVLSLPAALLAEAGGYVRRRAGRRG